jgi:hypothetical protein
MCESLLVLENQSTAKIAACQLEENTEDIICMLHDMKTLELHTLSFA